MVIFRIHAGIWTIYFRQHSGTYQARLKFGVWLFSWIILTFWEVAATSTWMRFHQNEGRFVKQSTIPTTIQHSSSMFYIHPWNFWSVLFYDSNFFCLKVFWEFLSWFIPLAKICSPNPGTFPSAKQSGNYWSPCATAQWGHIDQSSTAPDRSACSSIARWK